MWVTMLWYFNQHCKRLNRKGRPQWEILWGGPPGRLPTAQVPRDLFSNGFLMMSTVLFPAELTMGPLLALGLPGFMRGSPALPSGPHATPTSFSSSSSTDGDLDFQSPEGSQGYRHGKGELAGLRLGVDSAHCHV